MRLVQLGLAQRRLLRVHLPLPPALLRRLLLVVIALRALRRDLRLLLLQAQARVACSFALLRLLLRAPLGLGPARLLGGVAPLL